MIEEDEIKETTQDQECDAESDQINTAGDTNDDMESSHIDTAEELVKKKADYEFEASGNMANIQIFMQNADFKDGTGLKQILDLANANTNHDKKYNLEKEDDCSEFFRNCKNKDYITLAIILSVFEIVSISDISNLKDSLAKCLPPVFQLDHEGKKTPTPETDPYLSLNDVLSVIHGNIFVTEEGRQCIGYGNESAITLRNIWTQFSSLRKSIITWLLKMNDTFKYQTTFEAYQITTAFVRVISEDFLYAEHQIFIRLYSDPDNLGLLARLAQELLKNEKYQNNTYAMVLGWAGSGSDWLWKAALLVYLYADVPFSDNKLENTLTLTMKKKFRSFNRADLNFIAAFSRSFVKMRSLMTDIFYYFCTSEKKYSLEHLSWIYFYLIKYGYYAVNKNLIDLPFVVCDSKKQINNITPVLTYIMSQYTLRCQLYYILRVYLKEIANYNVTQQTIKHITAYFYMLAQNDYDYSRDILLFLKECEGGIAKNVYHMLVNIYKGGNKK